MALVAEQAILVVVDVQGKLATLVQNSAGLSSSIQTLVKSASLFEMPLLWVEQLPNKLGPTIAPISNLINELYPSVKPIAKSSFGSLGCDEFCKQLDTCGRKQIVLTGIEAHVCVYQTAQALLAKGFEVFVVIDAVSSRTEQNYQLGLKRMEQMGAVLTSVEMALFELQQVAEGERFADIIKLIR